MLAGFGSATGKTPPIPTESTSTTPPTEATAGNQLCDWQGPESNDMIHNFARENAGLINLQTRSERIDQLEEDLSVAHSRIDFLNSELQRVRDENIALRQELYEGTYKKHASIKNI